MKLSYLFLCLLTSLANAALLSESLKMQNKALLDLSKKFRTRKNALKTTVVNKNNFKNCKVIGNCVFAKFAKGSKVTKFEPGANQDTFAVQLCDTRVVITDSSNIVKDSFSYLSVPYKEDPVNSVQFFGDSQKKLDEGFCCLIQSKTEELVNYVFCFPNIAERNNLTAKIITSFDEKIEKKVEKSPEAPKIKEVIKFAPIPLKKEKCKIYEDRILFKECNSKTEDIYGKVVISINTIQLVPLHDKENLVSLPLAETLLETKENNHFCLNLVTHPITYRLCAVESSPDFLKGLLEQYNTFKYDCPLLALTKANDVKVTDGSINTFFEKVKDAATPEKDEEIVELERKLKDEESKRVLLEMALKEKEHKQAQTLSEERKNFFWLNIKRMLDNMKKDINNALVNKKKDEFIIKKTSIQTLEKKIADKRREIEETAYKLTLAENKRIDICFSGPKIEDFSSYCNQIGLTEVNCKEPISFCFACCKFETEGEENFENCKRLICLNTPKGSFVWKENNYLRE